MSIKVAVELNQEDAWCFAEWGALDNFIKNKMSGYHRAAA